MNKQIKTIKEILEFAAKQNPNIFVGADLHGANLAVSEFIGTNFSGANLKNARLPKSNIWETNFQGADLRGTDFRQCSLWKTNFRCADLRGADFFGAIFSGADFCGADLRGAVRENFVWRSVEAGAPRKILVSGLYLGKGNAIFDKHTKFGPLKK